MAQNETLCFDRSDCAALDIKRLRSEKKGEILSV